MIRHLIDHFTQILLPHTCVLCQCKSENLTDLCQYCYQQLPWSQPACQQCAMPLTDATQTHCGQCLKKPPPFEKTLALFAYKRPITHMINQLKFHNRLVQSKILGDLLANKIIQHYESHEQPELIIPVPLHKKRLQTGGYNQSLELAKPISRHLNIPIENHACIRIKNTQAQSSLHAKRRKHNTKNAFSLISPIDAQHIAILDDVVTTGSTVTEFSQMLRKHQSNMRIDVWCCARTL